MSLPDSAIIREPRVTLLSKPGFVEPEHLRVHRHGVASDGEQLAEYAGRLRHLSHSNPAQRETREYLAQFRDANRPGALEHAHYSLLIEGVSASASHEIAQHGAALVVTELSQRHTDANDVRVVVPPALIGDTALEAAWRAHAHTAVEAYRELTESLLTRFAWINDKTQRRRLAREAARAVLPNCVETRLVLTANARVWRAFIAPLAHENAEFELRRLAIAVLELLRAEAPAFFDDFAVYTAADRRQAARSSARPV